MELVMSTANSGKNTIHGGRKGFAQSVWTLEDAPMKDNESSVKLTYLSKDGEEGYPGKLDVEVIWRLTGPMELSLDMTARTDRPTVVNLTNHSFFNLAGACSGRNILDHHLTVAAEDRKSVV